MGCMKCCSRDPEIGLYELPNRHIIKTKIILCGICAAVECQQEIARLSEQANIYASKIKKIQKRISTFENFEKNLPKVEVY